jgi:S-formylglutathione hydrolase FrmB
MVLHGYIDSDVLEQHTGLSVILPAKRDAPCRVVYLLHGIHGNNDDWFVNTDIAKAWEDENIAFICPEVGRSFYVDMEYGPKAFTYVSEELPAICKKAFNISSERENTAVIGCSMGGYGALKIALSKPEAYSFCGAISPAPVFENLLAKVRKLPEEQIKAMGKELYSIWHALRLCLGEDLRLKPEDDIMQLAQKTDSAPLKPKIYTACGLSDTFHKPSLAFVDAIRKDYHYDLTWEDWAGGHEWTFFGTALKKALKLWNA